jgi:carbohydrate-selective porin OprB
MGLARNGEPPQDERELRPFFGSRDQDRGIRIDPVYYGECFTNARGGISTAGATQYEGLLNLPSTLDFERLRVPVPGKFFLLAQNTHGRGLTEDFVGDTMVLSNIDSFQNASRGSWGFSGQDTVLVTGEIDQPDLQYIATPSGIHRDALALGVRFQVTL